MVAAVEESSDDEHVVAKQRAAWRWRLRRSVVGWSGDPDITVSVAQVGPARLEVSIRDDDIPLYFAGCSWTMST